MRPATKKDVKPFSDFLSAKANLDEVISESQYDNLYVSYAPTPDFSQSQRIRWVRIDNVVRMIATAVALS